MSGWLLAGIGLLVGFTCWHSWNSPHKQPETALTSPSVGPETPGPSPPLAAGTSSGANPTREIESAPTESLVVSPTISQPDSSPPQSDLPGIEPPEITTPAVLVSAEAWRSVRDDLTAARQLAGERNWQLAEQHLASARQQLAQLGQLEQSDSIGLPAAYRRLHQVVQQAQEYWHAIDEGWRRLTAARELLIDESPVAVVEVTEQRVVLRAAGQNRTFARTELPGKIARAIAQTWLSPDSPSSLMLEAAFQATETEFQDPQVRQLWESAAAAGAEVGDTPLVLDDNYDLLWQLHTSPP